MNNVVHTDDEEDDVADFASYTDEHLTKSIRLKSGIDVQ